MLQALDYQTYKTHKIGIKVALDGLNSYLRVLKKAHNCADPEICDSFPNYYEDVKSMIELEFNGLDLIENCQNHPDNDIFKMAQKILTKHFVIQTNSENDTITQIIDSVLQE